MTKQTLYILVVLIAGILIGNATGYIYYSKLSKSNQEVIIEAINKNTTAINNTFDKIKTNKGTAVLDLTSGIVATNTSDSLKDSTKKGFLNFLKRKKRNH